ncbi:MAG: adenosylcobinamide-GDP ribazoletransferase [Bacillota bacterium]
MKSLRLAFTLLTVFPVGEIKPAGGDWRKAALFFPLVGAVLGALAAGLAVLGRGIAPPPLTAALALAALFLLTRGLHTDGLSDTADGLLGGMDRKRSLQIMRSGAAGPMGVAAVMLTFLIKFAALIALPDRLPVLLFFTPLCGRWCMVLAGAAFNPARNEGLGSTFISGLGWRHFSLASLVGGALCCAGIRLGGGFFPVATGTGLSFAVAGAAAVGMARRLGGLTGDTLGAVNEIAETAFLVAAALGFSLF